MSWRRALPVDCLGDVLRHPLGKFHRSVRTGTSWRSSAPPRSPGRIRAGCRTSADRMVGESRQDAFVVLWPLRVPPREIHVGVVRRKLAAEALLTQKALLQDRRHVQALASDTVIRTPNPDPSRSVPSHWEQGTPEVDKADPPSAGLRVECCGQPTTTLTTSGMTKRTDHKSHPDSDRRLRQADRLARVLRLLQLVLGRGKWNPGNLAVEQECSERTVYRDLNVLELAGIPWFFDVQQGCYSVRGDFRFPVLNLTDDELLGQATATAVTAAPGLSVGAGAAPTTRKLTATATKEVNKLLNDAGRLVEVLDLKLADHSHHHEVIRTIQWALLQGKQLVGHYQSPYRAKPVKLTVHPYRLCLVKQAWYLIGRPAKEKQPKTYRGTRFKSLRMLDAPAEVPQDFDLQNYFGNAWGVYRGDRTYDVEVEFTREAAPLVSETSWHHTQQIKWHKDGRVSLTFRIDGLGEILWWVLGWAGRAKVIKPPQLRELVVEQLREALRINEQ